MFIFIYFKLSHRLMIFDSLLCNAAVPLAKRCQCKPTSVVNFIPNDHLCRILFLIWMIESGFVAFKSWNYFNGKTNIDTKRILTLRASNKGYLRCGQTNNMTCRYEYRINVTSTPTGIWINMSYYKNSIFLFITWRRCYSVANVMS